jgi:hypothetical protein
MERVRQSRTARWLRLAALTLTLACGAVASLAHAAEADARPSRGLTMGQVEARYGAPVARSAAVGQPPITRWEYPSFVVYFENDRVIHAVVTGAPPAPAAANSG